LGWDDVRSDDRGKLVSKPFHSAVRQKTFRLSSVEVFRDPGWLETTETVGVEAVQGSVKSKELWSELEKKFKLIVCESERGDRNTPRRRACGGVWA
jgi:hypothetical protein